MKQPLFLLIILLGALSTYAQQTGIVWQGKMRLQGGAAKEMNLRLELVMDGANCIGMLYTRASEKGSVFGCDYIVNGVYLNNFLDLKQVKVVRSVLMRGSECEQFEKLSLRTAAKDSFMNVSGKWIWQSGDFSNVNFVQLKEEVSEMTIDEFTAYRTELFQLYEEQSVFLPAAERMNPVVFQTVVDSTDLIVDIIGTTPNSTDSIQLFLNGDAITQSHSVSTGQLRVRIKSIANGENELTLVNTSANASKLLFNIGFTQNGKTKTSNGVVSFARNAVFIIRRNQ